MRKPRTFRKHVAQAALLALCLMNDGNKIAFTRTLRHPPFGRHAFIAHTRSRARNDKGGFSRNRSDSGRIRYRISTAESLSKALRGKQRFRRLHSDVPRIRRRHFVGCRQNKDAGFHLIDAYPRHFFNGSRHRFGYRLYARDH